MSNNELAQIINKQIIDAIIASPLNIQFIPDDIEREMYEKILTVIEDHLVQPSCWKRMFSLMKKIFGCCKSKKDKTE